MIISIILIFLLIGKSSLYQVQFQRINLALKMSIKLKPILSFMESGKIYRDAISLVSIGF